ncbi:MAG: NAD-dependent epimerase/dehydratase family protein [Wenzhouxiangellaceae bacterium]|nr:NAD-dependent epimerase/dehydratase family protein [Wenzhouxiangellaceae bacterium]
MRNLVTGGSGFIGAHLVRALRARGEHVRVLDMRAPEPAIDGVDYRSGSINDAEALQSAVAGCERVFHLAAIAHLWVREREQFQRVNVDGSCAVLAAARAAGVKCTVHVSSESMLIDARRGRGRQQIDESTTVNPEHLAGPYCVSKWRAEQAATNAVREHGQHVVVCTPTVPVGPNDPWLTPPTRMLLDLVRRQLPAWLDTTLNYVDVRDVAEGLVRAAERGEPGRRYLLGGENLAMDQLLERLGRISGVKMPRLRVPWRVAWLSAHINEAWSDRISGKPPAAPLTGVRLAGAQVEFDNRRTRAELDWQPRALDQSLADALADFRIRGLV